jgi:hypothetical protein
VVLTSALPQMAAESTHGVVGEPELGVMLVGPVVEGAVDGGVRPVNAW